LIKKAKAEGFDQVGITGPDLPPRHEAGLENFIQQGWYGDMSWMEEKLERRRDPLHLWPNTKSIIMLAMNYGPEETPLLALDEREKGTISVYAKGKDYHDIIKKKLKNIARWLVGETGAEVKVFVDTAPVMEKPLAMAAGLGWQGKHTNLVSREKGSWIFLGAIFTTADLPEDKTEEDHCGRCTRCLSICPTNAFPAPYQLDARRCISYLTIEHNSSIPEEFREAIGNRVYGCDDCLAICPWNKFAEQASEQRLHPRLETDNPALKELLTMSDDDFRTRFRGTPVKRTGRARFLRNCLIAAGNSGEVDLLGDVIALLEDKEELIRGAAIWAVKKLSDLKTYEKLKSDYMPKEQNETVLAEWRA
jgi:epoxyqueuosine reductase